MSGWPGALLHLRHVAGDAGRRAARVAARALLLGGVDDAVLALLPHVDLLVVGPHVAGAAGRRLHGLLGREGVTRVAAVALADRAVGAHVADVVAALAHLVALRLGHDLVARGGGHAGPALGVFVHVGARGVLVRELRVLIRVTAGLGAGARRHAALRGVDRRVIRAVARDAGHSGARHGPVRDTASQDRAGARCGNPGIRPACTWPRPPAITPHSPSASQRKRDQQNVRLIGAPLPADSVRRKYLPSEQRRN